MFGYLKLSSRTRCNSKKRYRQVYASLCSWQRQTFGVRASILISYEAVFLFQLAVDAGLVDPPAKSTPTCCKLKNDWPNHWNVNPEAAEFASAFAILLARIKVEDDIRDSGNWLARGANWFWAKAFRQSNGYFNNLDDRLIPEIDRLVDQHLGLEKQQFSGSPEEYAAPTADAFSVIFKSFASQVLKVSADKVELFSEIGQAIGAGILLSDCVFDFQRDLRRGEFNPIQNSNQLPAYRQASLKAFSRAGWDCEQLAVEQGSPIAEQIIAEQIIAEQIIACQILRFGFTRIDQFNPIVATKPLDSQFRTPRRLHQRSSLRTGDCDIPCDGCCECASGCDGCDSVGCCDGGADTGAGADSPPMCISGFFCCDPCIDPGCDSKKKKPQIQPSIESLKPDSIMDADLVDRVGVADCTLNPTGYIVVDGERYPAKTNGQFCDTGQQVLVISKSSFGFIVEPIED